MQELLRLMYYCCGVYVLYEQAKHRVAHAIEEAEQQCNAMYGVCVIHLFYFVLRAETWSSLSPPLNESFLMERTVNATSITKQLPYPEHQQTVVGGMAG